MVTQGNSKSFRKVKLLAYMKKGRLRLKLKTQGDGK